MYLPKGCVFLIIEKVNKTYKYSYEEKMKIENEYYSVEGLTYSLARKYNVPRDSIKIKAIIEYLKNNDGHNYKLCNRLCQGIGNPDSG